LALLPELLAVLNRQGDGGFPKLGPGGMSAAGPLGLLGRYVQGAAATLLGPSDIEVGTVAVSGIAMTSAVGVATAAGGFREATLDHGRGGAKQFAKQLLPTHINILGTLCVAVKQKSMF
jgi:hypothetical protein